jgi:long-chain acyl-CoA synthetase
MDQGAEVRLGKLLPGVAERLEDAPVGVEADSIGGKDRDYVTTIVNIDFAMVSKWAQKHHLNYTTFVDLSQKGEVAELVATDLKRVNSYLPEASRVRRFVLLHKEFDADEAELTRTRKLRRGFMLERYKDLIDAIYDGNREIRVEAPVTYRDGRRGVVTTGIKVRRLEEAG